ncbi:Cyclin H,1 isoform 2 [Hibiscus syriacus]|uniref:Cyclin H,1 isoform 2 n=1 Tax=Hibiscus syriacus TaxID=106335 RepID=A0A6A2Y3T2_HIBSY|nr:Cyclin H,1 isoform 2 [Hibiscus syriacus]
MCFTKCAQLCGLNYFGSAWQPESDFGKTNLGDFRVLSGWRKCLHSCDRNCWVEKYKSVNQRAIQTLEKYGTTQMGVDAEGSISYPEPIARDNADKRPKPLNIEEEQFMRVFYENKLREVCSAFYFPNKIQCLEFDLIVFAPYRSLEGFFNDMEEFCGVKDDENQMLKVIFVTSFNNIMFDSLIPTQDLQETARLEVDKIMLTDAPHLFPPGQLALAALRSANEMHRVLDFEGYLRSLLARQNSENSVLLFIESLNAIDVWVRKYKFPTEKDMRHINRKLKSCLGHDEYVPYNPFYVDTRLFGFPPYVLRGFVLMIIGFVMAVRSRRRKGTNPIRVQMKLRTNRHRPLLNRIFSLAH